VPSGLLSIADRFMLWEWSKKHPDDATVMGGFLFFRYLQNERSDLLDFRAVGSKWQIVHGWIQDRVKN
jgi:hypothetical protein